MNSDTTVDLLQDRLQAFAATFDRARLFEHIALKTTLDEAKISDLLETYFNEGAVGLKLIAPLLNKELRILEVGSGVGLLTSFLKREGFDITGLEPAQEGGFDFMQAMSFAISEEISVDQRPEILPIGASSLNETVHGKFDLIFSVNVMEHVADLANAFNALTNVLAPNGKMIHSCPNYHFPYEPHLGIPLVPFVPRLTRFFLPGTVRRMEGIWNTLNFITATQVTKLARRNGLKAKFERGIMARTYDRLFRDPVFAARHKGLIGKIAVTPLLGGLVGVVLRTFPARLATPMIVTFTCADSD